LRLGREADNDRCKGEFYKTFTRPVAKCLLLAMFTYQLAYYAWVKLETDEIKTERNGMFMVPSCLTRDTDADDVVAEMATLEEQVQALQSKASKA
jgi:hypothetical protein